MMNPLQKDNPANCGVCKLCRGELEQIVCPICGSKKAQEVGHVSGWRWRCDKGHIYTPNIDFQDVQLHQKLIEKKKARNNG